MEVTGLEQHLHDDGNATDRVEIGHVELAVRLHVGDVRHARADAVEVVELELHMRFVRDREEVQHRVRGAAERHRHRDRVLECFLRHDLTRPQIELEQLHHRAPALEREVVAAAVDRSR